MAILDTWSDKGIHYKTGAPYFRIGMDYNALYNKKHGHMILVGLRYAATSFKYDVEALGINDPEYGGSLGNPNLIDGIWGNSLPFNYKRNERLDGNGPNFVSVYGRMYGKTCIWVGRYVSNSV